MFVIHVNKPKATNCQIPLLLLFPMFLRNKFSLMYGDRLPLRLAKHSYYVIFIDSFNKFTCIYFFKKGSDVYKFFLNFQQYVECKVVNLSLHKLYWGVEYEKLNSFFQENKHHSPRFMPTNKMALHSVNIDIWLSWYLLACQCIYPA
jgi:hypothetical protein